MFERSELRDIPREEQGDGPVERDPHLPAQRGHVDEVIRAVQEPRGEASDAQPEWVGDAPVVAERAEHPLVPVYERAWRKTVEDRRDVLGEQLRLAEGMLRRRR